MLCGTAFTQRSLYCQPSATDQQSGSQLCTDLVPVPLSCFTSVSFYLAFPLCQRRLLSLRLLPSPTACSLPMVHDCLAASLPSCLLFLQSCCLCAWVSVHLPVSLPATSSSQYLTARKRPACELPCQSARLSACLFVICLRLFLFICSSICLFTCLSFHLSLICLSACFSVF